MNAFPTTCHQGVARIRLSALKCDNGTLRFRREKEVHRVHQIFKTQGCNRTFEANFVSATVGYRPLRNALEAVGWSVEDFRRSRKDVNDLPLLPLELVRCLDGFHILEAAKRFLTAEDDWWPVCIYSAGTRGNELDVLSWL